MARRFHRIRHYQDRFSNFDLIEECEKPGPCLNCQFLHPLCEEDGTVIKEAEPKTHTVV